MTTDLIAAVTNLPILTKEQDDTYFSQSEYNDPRKAAEEIGKNPHFLSDCITWTYRESKTEYFHRLYRTGESTWIIASNYEFLD